jgi:hypothetical protein
VSRWCLCLDRRLESERERPSRPGAAVDGGTAFKASWRTGPPEVASMVESTTRLRSLEEERCRWLPLPPATGPGGDRDRELSGATASRWLRCAWAPDGALRLAPPGAPGAVKRPIWGPSLVSCPRRDLSDLL